MNPSKKIKSDVIWNERFTELKKFKLSYGHCNVPRDSEHPVYKLANLRLAHWVLKQRQLYRKGKLLNDRIRKLEKLSFEWKPFNNQWENHFKDLSDFKEKNGNCLVPRVYPENKKLAKWVIHMRTYKYRLSEEHVRRLDELGFVWKLDPNRPIPTLHYFKKKLEKI